MTFKIKTLTLKNFLSIGAVTQAIDFDRTDITLVLGENLDLGGDGSGSRNGTGKTSALNGLSYALYGSALTNIKKDNLVNRTNGKNMLVTVEFEKDNTVYRIERGRKPNVMRFWVGDSEQELDNDAQGDSRETQRAIEHMIGMSHDMFKHVVALNTYTEPFLSLKANDQRTIIEQLLGITLLSEKADALKEIVKETKDAIQQEEYRIKAVGDANKRIEDQIASLKRKQVTWKEKQDSDVVSLQVALDELLTLDIDAELAAHKQVVLYQQRKRDATELSMAISREKVQRDKETTAVTRLDKELALLLNHQCHSCGQKLHDDTHTHLLQSKQELLTTALASIAEHNKSIASLELALAELGPDEQCPTVFYSKEEDAILHRGTIENISQQITSVTSAHDLYEEQINEMVETALEEICFKKINELTTLKEHQEFLLKLLTNKDSFVRKRIIDQNLGYLNARLSQYLDRIGLPHQVIFQNDLTVSISELGRDLDFDNLSRGERTRLILSLSWAFRDVWEASWQPINLLFVDELIDSGLDSAGVESALAILKKMARDNHKSIWLVSHKDELVSRVNNILSVVKENGFSSFAFGVEIN